MIASCTISFLSFAQGTVTKQARRKDVYLREKSITMVTAWMFDNEQTAGTIGAPHCEIISATCLVQFVSCRGCTVRRERALKIVLVLVGLLFTALVYPLMMFVKQEPALAMMLSVYVTLGIFLLLAARNPSANRSLIAFAAWSSFAHAALMAVQALRNLIARGELLGVAALVIIGVALIALAPAKPVERVLRGVA
jgi:hypothetical protein